ncbi:MAG TPA: UbiH/UbiF/VisC/COQ6 family ubiquinone biosynthesis hydroxylase [Coxiellaceae bacterium]|nr:MAG: hypothetical protein A3E81_04475 [Gammaproteobacteria bacterium RIFCSPHIGHO2_12_FULL_36_30]HLB55988.1 UbiH/UbiF/VisC/COQ6 family ubiquinone biosynthesis hydroxylase [Coxiellaceae bacterium]
MKDDVVIVGAGIVGLTLAALLAKNNFSVSIIEEKKFNFSENNLTARVSAIHLTSVKLLEHINVWAKLEKNAAPLYEMKIWDHTQNAHLHFDSRDVNELQMGFIVENRAIIKTLYEKLNADKNITFFCPHVPNDFVFEQNNLIIGADGANSWVRKQMLVNVKLRSYQQKAIIAVIESEKPHENIAIQKFLTTGPVALLPLKNKNHTALVWSADNLISDELMQKSDEKFSDELTNALDFKLGKLKNITERSQFVLTMQHADDYVSENCALVGDAAHTIHPLAGLGVNLGLMDAACLAQTLTDARENKKNINDLRVLRRYARSRKADNSAVICAMRALQEIFASNKNAFNFIRSFGVNAIDQSDFLKNQLMKLAMGKSKDLPIFLQ